MEPNIELLLGTMLAVFYCIMGLGVSRAVGFHNPVFEMLLWPVVLGVVAAVGNIEYKS